MRHKYPYWPLIVDSTQAQCMSVSAICAFRLSQIVSHGLFESTIGPKPHQTLLRARTEHLRRHIRGKQPEEAHSGEDSMSPLRNSKLRLQLPLLSFQAHYGNATWPRIPPNFDVRSSNNAQQSSTCPRGACVMLLISRLAIVHP
jgi:hypothetical protein